MCTQKRKAARLFLLASAQCADAIGFLREQGATVFTGSCTYRGMQHVEQHPERRLPPPAEVDLVVVSAACMEAGGLEGQAIPIMDYLVAGAAVVPESLLVDMTNCAQAGKLDAAFWESAHKHCYFSAGASLIVFKRSFLVGAWSQHRCSATRSGPTLPLMMLCCSREIVFAGVALVLDSHALHVATPHDLSALFGMLRALQRSSLPDSAVCGAYVDPSLMQRYKDKLRPHTQSGVLFELPAAWCSQHNDDKTPSCLKTAVKVRTVKGCIDDTP